MSLTLHPARRLPAATHRTSLAPLSSSLLSAQLPFCRHSSPATRRSCLSPLFVAFPYISRLSPLSTAFTYFDRGYGVQPSKPPALFSPFVCPGLARRGGRGPGALSRLISSTYKPPLTQHLYFHNHLSYRGGGIPTLLGNERMCAVSSRVNESRLLLARAATRRYSEPAQ